MEALTKSLLYRGIRRRILFAPQGVKEKGTLWKKKWKS